MKAGIITVSDKGSQGLREDTSGPLISEMIKSIGCETVEYTIVPDDKDQIQEEIIRMCDLNLNLVFTTGGTGFSKRDVTPEATLKVIEKQIPGIPEAMRMKSFEKVPAAILSRGVAGIRQNSIVINLPGSYKAVKENLEIILPALKHGVEILIGDATECGSVK